MKRHQEKIKNPPRFRWGRSALQLLIIFMAASCGFILNSKYLQRA